MKGKAYMEAELLIKNVDAEASPSSERYARESTLPSSERYARVSTTKLHQIGYCRAIKWQISNAQSFKTVQH